ncbi:MAG: sulfite exporter TauE/SafE family protein [Gammaproteobacteria bacterium]|nr:sulfite exporter TauE/SafE family protein [Gammaproteobacteria bacterium]
MSELLPYQYVLIGLLFIWGGFVRSGVGFGGAVLALPFLLLIRDQPLVFLPIIAIHLLLFSSLTVVQNHRKAVRAGVAEGGTVDWAFLRYALLIMAIPKLIGVFGVITLPGELISGFVFVIVTIYAITYILDRPFKSNNKWLDILFLMLGGYVSGTSLIAAPLVVPVAASRVLREQLRDTLFALWFILVAVKLAAFIYAGVDLQLIHQLWLLPCATVGHGIGLRFHEYTLRAETKVFFRVMGVGLLAVSLVGLWRILY